MNESACDRIGYVPCIAAMFLLAVACGCRDEPSAAVSVEGSVRIDGVLLREGLVTFIPQGTTLGPKASAVVEQGHYEIAAEKGLQAGAFRVEVFGMPSGVKARVDGLPPESPAAEYREIADEFNTDSRLNVILDEGDNLEDFDVDYR